MPLKLSIGLSRKMGEANYGSRGATVGLEVEVEASLVDQPQEFHERIAHLFELAQQAVDQELAGPAVVAPQCAAEDGANPGPDARQATFNQRRAIHAIAASQRLDLAAELQNRFGVDRPERLTLLQASALIDALKTTARLTTLSVGGQ